MLFADIPITTADGTAFDLSSIPLWALERVEVYRGGAPDASTPAAPHQKRTEPTLKRGETGVRNRHCWLEKTCSLELGFRLRVSWGRSPLP